MTDEQIQELVATAISCANNKNKNTIIILMIL